MGGDWKKSAAGVKGTDDKGARPSPRALSRSLRFEEYRVAAAAAASEAGAAWSRSPARSFAGAADEPGRAAKAPATMAKTMMERQSANLIGVRRLRFVSRVFGGSLFAWRRDLGVRRGLMGFFSLAKAYLVMEILATGRDCFSASAGNVVELICRCFRSSPSVLVPRGAGVASILHPA